MTSFCIKVHKEYFNFAAAHFMLFSDGSREPLHGHNYRVRIEGHGNELKGDMVFDFLDIKPIVKEACDVMDHKLLLPKENLHLRFEKEGRNVKIITQDEYFSVPESDVLFVPIENTSVERIAVYLAREIKQKIWERFQFSFTSLVVEVEESPGQSAVFSLE